jgi:hypothetical protein
LTFTYQSYNIKQTLPHPCGDGRDYKTITERRKEMKARNAYRFIIMASVAALALTSISCSSSSDDDPTYRPKAYRNYNADGVLTSTYYFVYDDEGKYSGNYMTDAEGVITLTQKYTYDSPYGYTKSANYDTSGELTTYTLRTYNSSGKLTESKGYDKSGVLSSTATITYDAEGRRTRQDNVNESGTTYAYLYEYDADGNRTKRTMYFDGEISSYAKYSCENGRWSRIETYDTKDVLLSSMEYDWEEGNRADDILSNNL